MLLPYGVRFQDALGCSFGDSVTANTGHAVTWKGYNFYFERNLDLYFDASAYAIGPGGNFLPESYRDAMHGTVNPLVSVPANAAKRWTKHLLVNLLVAYGTTSGVRVGYHTDLCLSISRSIFFK
jgi:hypothetical protein